ncbi:hypothetical protein GCM10027067_19760 [Pseudactinotalea suaedae]
MLFLPPVYDWLWTLGTLGAVLAMLAAIVQISRSRVLTGSTQLVWTLTVLFVPLMGALAWFLLRPRDRASADR